MEEINMTLIRTVRLLGFQVPKNITFLVFTVFLIIYCVTICGNLLIIAMVAYSRSLHSPMYFFLSQLSVLDILLATDILPNLLCTVLVEDVIILLSACIAQFYFFCVLETTECLLLTVMSYDRYLAICHPLHYTLKMSFNFCWTTVVTAWALCAVIMLIYVVTISKLEFCNSNIIDHFFCDIDPIIKLSCSDTFVVHLEMTLLGAIFIFPAFCIIVVSYTYIIVTIFEMSSIAGRQKAFTTCSSHLTIVCMYYAAVFCVYLVPKEQSWAITKFLSLLYTVITPLMNPIIYSLRNVELKQVVRTLVSHTGYPSLICKLHTWRNSH
ncbi:olfactory receptor 1G1-like [Gastrophryne carolinensis]